MAAFDQVDLSCLVEDIWNSLSERRAGHSLYDLQRCKHDKQLFQKFTACLDGLKKAA
ncbi:hypothetical protein [Desulfonatronovibrio magnus]|uniref:hypothetical protein n=1 Tax=Desulfonatronovibrio magnus TaxID=698827 RepID=UPI0012F95BE3|nr:hypothetical protein [Desulfonatronovibrio magnus]